MCVNCSTAGGIRPLGADKRRKKKQERQRHGIVRRKVATFLRRIIRAFLLRLKATLRTHDDDDDRSHHHGPSTVRSFSTHTSFVHSHFCFTMIWFILFFRPQQRAERYFLHFGNTQTRKEMESRLLESSVSLFGIIGELDQTKTVL